MDNGVCIRVAFALCLLISVSACTWVKLTPAGAAVNVTTADQVGGCKQIGGVAATTKDRILLQRDAEVVRKEQVTLAQNQAATIGGDTIVAKPPAQGPTLQFDVYRCH